MERECQRNLELVWLTERLTTDFKPVTDFRKNNSKGLRGVCREFVELCRRLEQLEKHIARYLGELDGADREDPAIAEAKAERLHEKIANIKEEMQRIKADIELNINAMMGMTMIVGIVTEVSIFYFSEYHELLRQGGDKLTALVQAGSNRMRPIAMTTLAAILALLPLALSQGSAMQQPLAVAIIAGLLVQILLVVVVVMPLLYRALARL